MSVTHYHLIGMIIDILPGEMRSVQQVAISDKNYNYPVGFNKVMGECLDAKFENCEVPRLMTIKMKSR